MNNNHRTMEVTALYIYPLKSARGMAVDEIVLDARGAEGDRRLMVVTPDGRFVTQRTLPSLALIDAIPRQEGLLLSMDGKASVAIPLQYEGKAVDVSIWDDRMQALSISAAVDQWISDALGVPLRIVAIGDSSRRPLNEGGELVAFPDAYPLLLTAEESLADLNTRLEASVPMDRFRPNIVIRGAEAFAEDRWRHIRIGPMELTVAKPCARCATIQVDQKAGQPGIEPLRTLSTFRRKGSKVLFGMNLGHHGPGRITLGDPVEVVA